MKFNKLILGAALVTPLFMGSCNTDTYIEVSMTTNDGAILNCGSNTIVFTLDDYSKNNGVKFADTLSASDFEISGCKELKGKKLSRVRNVDGYNAQAVFTGAIKDAENCNVTFNVKTTALKSTKSNIKIKSAVASTSLMKASLSKTDSNAYYVDPEEYPESEYSGTWYIIGTFNMKYSASSLSSTYLDQEIEINTTNFKNLTNIQDGAKVWFEVTGDELNVEIYNLKFTDSEKDASFTMGSKCFKVLEPSASLKVEFDTWAFFKTSNLYFTVA